MSIYEMTKRAWWGLLGVLGVSVILGGHVPGAWAQATDLVCDKCVGTSDIAVGAVRGGRIANNSVSSGKIKVGAVTTGKIAELAVTTSKLAVGAVRGGRIANGAVTNAKLGADVQQRLSDLEAIAQENLPFYITLDTADGTSIDAIIATNGPLEYIARCTDNGTGGMDKIEIIATSTAAAWFEEGTVVIAPNGPGDEVVGMSRDEPDGSLLYEDFGHGSSSVADDGSFLAIIRFGLGLNLFGHDCLVVGTAEAITGAP